MGTWRGAGGHSRSPPCTCRPVLRGELAPSRGGKWVPNWARSCLGDKSRRKQEFEAMSLSLENHMSFMSPQGVYKINTNVFVYSINKCRWQMFLFSAKGYF